MANYPRKESSAFVSQSSGESFFKSSKYYYSKIFLEECKYEIKEKEIKSFIKDDLKIGFDSEEKDIEVNSE